MGGFCHHYPRNNNKNQIMQDIIEDIRAARSRGTIKKIINTDSLSPIMYVFKKEPKSNRTEELVSRKEQQHYIDMEADIGLIRKLGEHFN
jgi:hypothetical protein